MKLLYPDGEIRHTSEDPVWQKFAGAAGPLSGDCVENGIKRLKLMAQDPVSGPGHYLYLPRGAMVFNLLKAYLYDLYAEFGCFYLESPMLTDYEHDAVRNHAEQSGEKTYHTHSSGRHLMTKIGALYSQLELVSRNGLAPAVMPLKLFEMTKCCRIEDRISPLRRACEFTMVDMHELCADFDQACEESIAVHQRILELGREFDMDFYCTYTVTDAFVKSHLPFLEQLVRIQEKEALLIRANPEKGRPLNLEYHVDSGTGSPLEVSAFQIDCQNPEKFNIRNPDGSFPVLVHANIVGSVERFMYALVARALDRNEFPLWLAPEQVRLVPPDAGNTGACLALAKRLGQEQIRVTVDDRADMTVTGKIQSAGDAMVPLVLAVDREAIELIRDGNASTPVSVEALLDRIRSETVAKPVMKATFPLGLSEWPDYF